MPEDDPDLAAMEAALERGETATEPEAPKVRRRRKGPSDESSTSPSDPQRRPSPRSKTAPAGPAKGKAWYLGQFNEMFAKGAYAGGEAISGAMPVTGTVLTIKSPLIGDAIEEAAKRDPRIYKVAKMVYDSQMWAAFAMIFGALAVAVAVDLHRMPVVMMEIETPEGGVQVGVNPVVRFALPKEALPVAVESHRAWRASHPATSESDGTGPEVHEPGWIGTAGGVEPAS